MKTYAPEHESILTEAYNVTHGPRQQDYGHPQDTYERVAGMVNALFADKLAVPLTAADITQIMICVKQSRERSFPKRDNHIDIAGFAWALNRCVEQEAHDYAQMEEETEQRPGTHYAEDDLLEIPAFLRRRPADLAGVKGSAGEFRVPVVNGVKVIDPTRIQPAKSMADRIRETEERAAQDELNERVNTENAG